MLKRKNRLTRSMPRNVKAISTPLFTLRISPNTLSESRVGFIVSKKVDSRAVMRNKLKRRASMCIASMKEGFMPSIDAQFLFKKHALVAHKDALCDEMKQAIMGGNV